MSKGKRKRGGRFWLVTMVPELSDVAEVLNITEGPFAFDPTLPDSDCSSSTSWQDQHLAGEIYQPPEERDSFIHSTTKLIYRSPLARCTFPSMTDSS